MAKMIFSVVAALAVSCVASLGQTSGTAESSKPSLAWMRDDIGKSSGNVVWDERFPVDVKAYLPRIPVTLPGGSNSPDQKARSDMNIAQHAYMRDGFVVASGCAAHACGLDAVLVLANTDANSPSLTVAFATQELNQGVHGTPPVHMVLHIYSSEPSTILSNPQALTIFQKWLQDNWVGHIDETFFATVNGFSTVPTPELLKHVSRNPAALR